MANLSDFLPAAGGGGGLTPKFQEFNSSGTFTPTQALIDAGGFIEIFIVGGGGRSSSSDYGAAGGEVIMKQMYLTSVTSCTVTIGAGGAVGGSGGNSVFLGSSAGGVDVTSIGGSAVHYQANKLSNSWGASLDGTAGNGVFGYGAGGGESERKGIWQGKANSGQGGPNNGPAGSGYCLIKYYE